MTNPERFAPLHDAALRLLDDLAATYAVTRDEGGEGFDVDLAVRHLVRPTVRLTPADASAAPITVAFTDFPGLIVRFGRWTIGPFPHCGCDACDETAEGEVETFRELVENVTAGRFKEAIDLPRVGRATRSVAFWSSRGSQGGETLIDRDEARRLLSRSESSSYEWRAWPLRG